MADVFVSYSRSDKGARRATRRRARGRGMVGLVGPCDRSRPAVRPDDRRRTGSRPRRAGRLDGRFRRVALGARRSPRRRRSRHPRAGAVRVRAPADRLPRIPHDEPRPSRRRHRQSAVPGSLARARGAGRAPVPRRHPSHRPSTQRPPPGRRASPSACCRWPTWAVTRSSSTSATASPPTSSRSSRAGGCLPCDRARLRSSIAGPTSTRRRSRVSCTSGSWSRARYAAWAIASASACS